MIAITLGHALRIFSKELSCNGVDEADAREILVDAVHEAVEHQLISGGGNLKREWRLLLNPSGILALPRDLETPIKYKFGMTANSGFGIFHSAYRSYSSFGVDQNCCGPEWKEHFEVLANYTPVQFQPSCRSQIVATTTNCEDVGKKIMVAGRHGQMTIAPIHNGYKTAGELLTIQHEDDKEKKLSSFQMDSIINVIKDETCDYVMLSAYNTQRGFEHLAWYHPDETAPQYRQIRVSGCGNCVPGHKNMIHVLGRVNPSIRYLRDEDVLPIDSITILKLLAKRARYDDLGDYAEVAAMEVRVQNAIKKVVSYQEPPGKKISLSLAGSPASQTNV